MKTWYRLLDLLFPMTWVTTYPKPASTKGGRVDQMGRVAPTFTQDVEFLKSNSNNAFYWAEPCAIFSGDSGTPCIGMSGNSPVLFGLLHSYNATNFNVFPKSFATHFSVEVVSYPELDIPSVEGDRITGPIQIKRSSTASATPSSLLPGELAINDADGKLFSPEQLWQRYGVCIRRRQ